MLSIAVSHFMINVTPYNRNSFVSFSNSAVITQTAWILSRSDHHLFLVTFIHSQAPSSAVGKLDIVWRSAMGEKGRLQTSQLQKAVGSMECVVDAS